jgi:hypothetical protein
MNGAALASRNTRYLIMVIICCWKSLRRIAFSPENASNDKCCVTTALMSPRRSGCRRPASRDVIVEFHFKNGSDALNEIVARAKFSRSRSTRLQ